MIQTLRQIAPLAARAALRTLRQPATIIPTLAFPLVFLTVVTAGASSAAKIPGFPADSYLAFVLAGAFAQGAMFAGIGAATELALDVESGFLNRLALSRVRRPALLLGQVTGGIVVGLLQVLTFLIVATVAGVHFRAGIAGMIVMVVLALIVSVAFSGLGAVLALRTGSSEAVQGMFPLFFIVLSFSSFFLPRPLIGATWFRTLATINPISYLIEAMRSLVITGWDGTALGRGFGIGAALVVVGLASAARALRTRMEHA